MDAAVRAFAAEWPDARISNLLDDSLFAWVREAGGVVPEMYDVFRNLTRHMIGRGADGILFTCSAFRPGDRHMHQGVRACPILKPNDAMIEKALDARLAHRRHGNGRSDDPVDFGRDRGNRR